MSAKILIADDEAHILHVLSMKLCNAGFEVLTAQDGEEALELYHAEQPALVITDYQMPFMTGLDLCRAMRESGSAVPTVLLTARGYDVEGSEMADAGIAAVLEKPFSPREVLALVEDLLKDSQTFSSQA
jgi:two-component system alkaline phosphatase synthesis response regulator PhoP